MPLTSAFGNYSNSLKFMSIASLEGVTDNELHLGIEKVFDNAKELIDEADFLFANDRYSRAYCLYQLASEEIGKGRLLFALIMNRKLGDKIDYKSVDKEFYFHQAKSKSALFFEMVAYLVMYSTQKDKSADERRDLFAKAVANVHDENNAEKLNRYKNDSLYVGLQNDKFVCPSELITQEMATNLRTDVLIRLEAGRTVLQTLLKNLENIIVLVKQAHDLPDSSSENFFNVFFKA